MRDVFASELLHEARRDPGLMFVTGDLGFGVFEDFQRELPRQYLNVGVAEQNMIAVATGLALEGHTVFAYSIGNFPVLRCLEQIRNDAAYHGANVKVVAVGGGFSYGPLGMSHHATEDIAVLRAIPEVELLIPGTEHETRLAFRRLIDRPGPAYLRLDKSNGTESADEVPWTSGTWRVIKPGDDIALIAVGGILEEAQRAAVVLESEGVSARVVSAIQIPVDGDRVLEAIGPCQTVITVEEHVRSGGLGSFVAEVFADTRALKRLSRMGIADTFVSEVGSQKHLRERIGISSSAIIERARSSHA